MLHSGSSLFQKFRFPKIHFFGDSLSEVHFEPRRSSLFSGSSHFSKKNISEFHFFGSSPSEVHFLLLGSSLGRKFTVQKFAVTEFTLWVKTAKSSVRREVHFSSTGSSLLSNSEVQKGCRIVILQGVVE